MGDRLRVLLACPRVWDSLDEYRDLFHRHGIEVDVPDSIRQQLTEEELLEVIHLYDGVLAGDDQLTRRVIEAASRLKVISKWGVGVDAIDLEAAAERGVIVRNTPGMFGAELADYALGFILLIARSQHIVDREVRAGNWVSIRGHSLAGRTLGIVGLGSSGSALAARATVMGMEVVACDPLRAGRDDESSPPLVEFRELLELSDVVSLHLPGQPGQGPLLDAKTITAAKPGFWLVNTSRGSLVDEDALLDGLISGQVGAAALDVFQKEPIEADHPLLQHPRVIVGAHNASNTHEAVARTNGLAIANLIEGLVGRVE